LSKIEVHLAKPWFGDEEPQTAAEVVKSEWLFMGPRVRQFEKEFAETMGSKHAIAVNSGSTALLMSLLALDVGAGDEILAPDMTFVSTASCSLFTGAVPRFVDITNDTYCMDPDDLERRITKKTKAIIPVHYAGQTAEMDRILDIAAKNNIRVIEDAAEAHLAKYGDKTAGTMGAIGIFSFTPSKPMTTGEGGMLTTDNDELAEKLRLIRNFGDREKFDWAVTGFNFRMMDIQGAIGSVQLKKLKECVRLRREIAGRFTDAFSALECIMTPYVRKPEDINFQLYTIRVIPEKCGIGRDRFMEELAGRGVASRLYYPALHRAPVFARFEPGRDEDFPVASKYADTAMSLPLYPTMTEQDIELVINSVTAVATEFAK
jgi:dTDP-4-amino-4,6-dideoxygalactose transaminase